MFYTVKFYKYYNTAMSPVYKETAKGLYEAMAVARKGTEISECGIAEIFDSHGQFIIHFRDGELKHGYD